MAWEMMTLLTKNTLLISPAFASESADSANELDWGPELPSSTSYGHGGHSERGARGSLCVG